MEISLRARLTAWYSLLVVLTVAVFAAAVLWLHWLLLLKQFDEGLESIAATADNVIAEELEERKPLSLAVEDMTAVVRAEDGVVQVLDAAGSPIVPASARMPLPHIPPAAVRTAPKRSSPERPAMARPPAERPYHRTSLLRDGWDATD